MAHAPARWSAPPSHELRVTERAAVRVRHVGHGADASERLVVDGEMDAMKERVGCAKMLHGDRAWRTAIAYVDPLARLPQLHRVPSRSYFKLVELAPMLDTPSNALLLCEAPGGFVQAVRDAWPKARWVAHSVAGDGRIPFKRLPGGGAVLAGAPADGDMLSRAGFEFVRGIGERTAATFDLITADGSVDMEHDHVHEERLNVLLILREALVAVRCQSEGGSFVLKVFGLEGEALTSLVWLLAHMYRRTRVVKPRTSRPTNSELYVVFSGFLGAEHAPPGFERLHALDAPPGGAAVQRFCDMGGDARAQFAAIHAACAARQKAALAAAFQVCNGRLPDATDSSVAFWEAVRPASVRPASVGAAPAPHHGGPPVHGKRKAAGR